MIGNPLFPGCSPQRETLGDDCIEAVRSLYRDAVAAFVDLVCHWFHKARKPVGS